MICLLFRKRTVLYRMDPYCYLLLQRNVVTTVKTYVPSTYAYLDIFSIFLFVSLNNVNGKLQGNIYL